MKWINFSDQYVCPLGETTKVQAGWIRQTTYLGAISTIFYGNNVKSSVFFFLTTLKNDTALLVACSCILSCAQTVNRLELTVQKILLKKKKERKRDP